MSNNSDDVNEVISLQYIFKFGSGLERKISLDLDEKTLDLIQTEKASYPKWTALRFSQCPICSLDEAHHEFCPIAINVVDLVDFFRDMISYQEIDLLIESRERGYIKHTTLQQGISSLFGIYMVTSGCPTMKKLKPMVRSHLPFATLRETQYRVLSMYLLAQYLLYRRGRKPDWQLKELVKIYDDIQIVNKHFFQRLTHIKIKDATLNALVKLDIFAKNISFSIDRDVLDDMERLFSAYLE